MSRLPTTIMPSPNPFEGQSNEYMRQAYHQAQADEPHPQDFYNGQMSDFDFGDPPQFGNGPALVPHDPSSWLSATPHVPTSSTFNGHDPQTYSTNTWPPTSAQRESHMTSASNLAYTSSGEPVPSFFNIDPIYGQEMPSSNTVSNNMMPANIPNSIYRRQQPYAGLTPQSNIRQTSGYIQNNAPYFNGVDGNYSPFAYNPHMANLNNIEQNQGLTDQIMNILSPNSGIITEWHRETFRRRLRSDPRFRDRVRNISANLHSQQSQLLSQTSRLPHSMGHSSADQLPYLRGMSGRMPVSQQQVHQEQQRQRSNISLNYNMSQSSSSLPSTMQQPLQLNDAHPQAAQTLNQATITVAAQLSALGPMNWNENFKSTSLPQVPENPRPTKRPRQSNKEATGSNTEKDHKPKPKRGRKPKGYYNDPTANSVLSLIQDSDSSPGSKSDKSRSPEKSKSDGMNTSEFPQPVDRQALSTTTCHDAATSATLFDSSPIHHNSTSAVPNPTISQDGSYPTSPNRLGAVLTSDPLSLECGYGPVNPYLVYNSELSTPEGRKIAVSRALGEAFAANPFAVPGPSYQPSRLNELAPHPRSQQTCPKERLEEGNEEHIQNIEESDNKTFEALQQATTTVRKRKFDDIETAQVLSNATAEEFEVGAERYGDDATNPEPLAPGPTAGVHSHGVARRTFAPHPAILVAASSTVTPQISPELPPTQAQPLSISPAPPPTATPPTPALVLEGPSTNDQEQHFDLLVATAPATNHLTHSEQVPHPDGSHGDDQPLQTNSAPESNIFDLEWDNVDMNGDFANGFDFLGTSAEMTLEEMQAEFNAYYPSDILPF